MVHRAEPGCIRCTLHSVRAARSSPCCPVRLGFLAQPGWEEKADRRRLAAQAPGNGSGKFASMSRDTTQSSSTSGGERGSIFALGISSDERDLTRLQEIFDRLGFRFHAARSYREAMNVLCGRRMPIIICEQSLPDGSWKDILSLLAPLLEPHQLLVMAAGASERLATEVREMCGLELLPKPLQEDDVVLAVARASQNWTERSASKKYLAGAA